MEIQDRSTPPPNASFNRQADDPSRLSPHNLTNSSSLTSYSMNCEITFCSIVLTPITLLAKGFVWVVKIFCSCFFDKKEIDGDEFNKGMNRNTPEPINASGGKDGTIKISETESEEGISGTESEEGISGTESEADEEEVSGTESEEGISGTESEADEEEVLEVIGYESTDVSENESKNISEKVTKLVEFMNMPEPDVSKIEVQDLKDIFALSDMIKSSGLDIVELKEKTEILAEAKKLNEPFGNSGNSEKTSKDKDCDISSLMQLYQKIISKLEIKKMVCYFFKKKMLKEQNVNKRWKIFRRFERAETRLNKTQLTLKEFKKGSFILKKAIWDFISSTKPLSVNLNKQSFSSDKEVTVTDLQAMGWVYKKILDSQSLKDKEKCIKLYKNLVSDQKIQQVLVAFVKAHPQNYSEYFKTILEKSFITDQLTFAVIGGNGEIADLLDEFMLWFLLGEKEKTSESVSGKNRISRSNSIKTKTLRKSASNLLRKSSSKIENVTENKE